MSLRQALLALAAGLSITACVPPPHATAPTETAPPELELVTYQVDPSQTAKVQAILRRVFSGVGEVHGTLSEAPGGRIAVLAPATVHEGVARLVADIGQNTEPDPAPANVRFTYWMVGGSPADTDTGPLPVALKPVSDTLAAIVGWDGPQWFRLVGHTTLTSIDGDRAEAESSSLQIQQIASIDPATGTIIADVDLELWVDDSGRIPKMETRVQVQPGQTLILSTLDGGGTLPGHLYVIVRADILPGA